MVNILQRMKNQIVAVIVGPPAASDKNLGQFAMSGPQVQQLTAQVEAGLLAKDGAVTYAALDQLVHLLAMQAEETRQKEPHTRSFSWHSGVARTVAARFQHAILRIPDFLARFDQPDAQGRSLAHALLQVLADFTNLTRIHMVEVSTNPLTPDDWFKAPPAFVAMRANLGVGFYHLSRVIEAAEDADQNAEIGRDKVFRENFDVMFYALNYGPLLQTDKTVQNQDLMQQHIDRVEAYLQSPQPALRDDPERPAIPTSHVVHIFSTVDRARDVLARLAG